MNGKGNLFKPNLHGLLKKLLTSETYTIKE